MFAIPATGSGLPKRCPGWQLPRIITTVNRLCQALFLTKNTLPHFLSGGEKSMAAADVIYGITMQEPGVSTRVAVKLEEAEVLVA